MKNTTQSRRRTGRQRLALLALAMGGLLASGNVMSTGIPVFDLGSLTESLLEFGREANRWGEQGAQWGKEAQQFTQQYNSLLSNVQNMQTSFGMSQGVQLEEVPEDFMVNQRCGEQMGGTAGILGKLGAFNFGDNPQAKRWQYCRDLQMMGNKQYNEMVKYLQETVPKMNEELNNAGKQFMGGQKTQGEMNQYAAKLSKVKGDIARSNEEFKARMDAYSVFAKAIKINQGTLTRGALRGHSGILQKVASVAVMKKALCGGGKCD